MSDNEAVKQADRVRAIYEGARLLIDVVKLLICLSVIAYMLKFCVACRAGKILLFQNTDGSYLKQDCCGHRKGLDSSREIFAATATG